MDSRLKVIALGGAPRSGSTAFGLYLGDKVGFTNLGEVRFVWRHGLIENRSCGCGVPFRECPFWTEVGRAAYGGWESVPAERIASIQRYVDRQRRSIRVAWDVARHRMRSAEAVYLEHVERLYRGVSEVVGESVFVDTSKAASYVFLLDRSYAMDVGVVHLVRDSRGTVYSWLRPKALSDGAPRTNMRTFSPARSSALWLGSNLPFHFGVATRQVRLRYEDFGADPESTVEAALSNLGLGAWCLEQTASPGKQHTVSGNPLRLAQFPGIQTDERWKDEMSTSTRRLVTSLTSPLLVAYGYPLRSSPPS